MQWTLVAACVLGILLLVLAGRFRERSLRRRSSHDPRLSPAQETQGAPIEPPARATPPRRAQSRAPASE